MRHSWIGLVLGWALAPLATAQAQIEFDPSDSATDVTLETYTTQGVHKQLELQHTGMARENSLATS